MKQWMIYGANGYTGQLIAEEAKRRGLAPILAGRNEKEVKALGDKLGLPIRIFNLNSTDLAASQLKDMDAVLHCAGPFSATSRPMLEACLKSRTHYLDITGEIDVFEFIHKRNNEIQKAGIVAIPGVGFDVVPTDCLAAMLHQRMPDATHLTLAFRSAGFVSPGTMKTMLENAGKGGRVRENATIITVPSAHKCMTIPFADKPSKAVTIPWGDVSTAYYSTRIPNIEVYMAAPPIVMLQLRMSDKLNWMFKAGPVQRVAKRIVGKLVKGPSEEERAKGHVDLWGQVRNQEFIKKEIKMRVPESYAFTVTAALESMREILSRDLKPGAYTPSKAFGADMVLRLGGVLG